MKTRFQQTVFFLLSGLLLWACTPGQADRPQQSISPQDEQDPITASPTEAAAPSDVTVEAGERIQPDSLRYLGAFRLPDDGERPRTFEYGGSAMTFRPGADTENDGFPGTLFITGHDRLAYGELPNGSQLAEVSIPAPVSSRDLNALNIASFVQGFEDVAAGQFNGLDELPRIGLAYLDHPATGPKLHLAWGQHMPPEADLPSHAWINTTLAAPDFQGEWFIGNQNTNSVNGYLIEIPAAWAEAYAGGRPLATGRYRDGGWSGMGPALYAYQPWPNADGLPAPNGTRLQEVVLLQYESSYNTPNIERALRNYQHPDEWEGAAWLTTPDGRSAVIFTGTKATGEKFWYGYVNPNGPQSPCPSDDFIGTACFMADGSPCPASDMKECAGHNDSRGWWSTNYEAQVLFYDPADLARVAARQMQPWEPQPYATLSLDSLLFNNPAGIEPDMLGTGPQRHYRIGEAAFDRQNGLLYILELFADGAKPVVHVWRIE